MLKWMLQRSIHSVFELLDIDVTLPRSIQSVCEVGSNGCYNVASRASRNWLPERVASWLKWMLQRKFQRLGVAWKRFSNITRENDSLRRKRSFRGSETTVLRLPHKSRGHIRPYPRVTFAPTPNWGRGKCDPRAPTEGSPFYQRNGFFTKEQHGNWDLPTKTWDLRSLTKWTNLEFSSKRKFMEI